MSKNYCFVLLSLVDCVWVCTCVVCMWISQRACPRRTLVGFAPRAPLPMSLPTQEEWESKSVSCSVKCTLWQPQKRVHCGNLTKSSKKQLASSHVKQHWNAWCKNWKRRDLHSTFIAIEQRAGLNSGLPKFSATLWFKESYSLLPARKS